MGLFDRKTNGDGLAPFLQDDLHDDHDLPESVNYNTVLEYLVGLSDEDYTKVCNVAAIYRKANQDAAAALGKDYEPTTFIEQPTNISYGDAPDDIPEPTLLDEDDADIAAILDDAEFIEDDPKPKKGGK